MRPSARRPGLAAGRDRGRAIHIHVGALDPGLLDEVEGLTGVDGAQLSLVADENQAMDFGQVCQPYQLGLVLVRHHRRLVEHQDMVSERAPSSTSNGAFPGSCKSLPHCARKRAMVIERMPVSRSSIWTSVFCTASPSTCLPSSRSSWATGFITLLLPAPAMPWIATISSRERRACRILLPFVERNSVVDRGNCLNRSAASGRSRMGNTAPRPWSTFAIMVLSRSSASWLASQPLCSLGLECAASDQCSHGFRCGPPSSAAQNRAPPSAIPHAGRLPRAAEMAHRGSNGRAAAMVGASCLRTWAGISGSAGSPLIRCANSLSFAIPR